MIPTVLAKAGLAMQSVVTKVPITLPAALRPCTALAGLRNIDPKSKELKIFVDSLRHGKSIAQTEFMFAGGLAPIHHWTKMPDEKGNVPLHIQELEEQIKLGMAPELLLKANPAMHGDYLHSHFTAPGEQSHFKSVSQNLRSCFVGYAHGPIARQPYMAGAPTVKSSDPSSQLKFPVSIFPRETDPDKKVMLTGLSEDLSVVMDLHLQMHFVDMVAAQQWASAFGYNNDSALPSSRAWYIGAIEHMKILYESDEKFQAFENKYNSNVLGKTQETMLQFVDRATDDRAHFLAMMEHLSDKGAVNKEGQAHLELLKEVAALDKRSPTLTI